MSDEARGYELVEPKEIDALMVHTFASEGTWLATRDRVHVEKNICFVVKRIEELRATHPTVQIETKARPIAGSTRLKVERSMSDHKRYVDFAFNSAPDAPLYPCFVWSFGEYGHADGQRNFDGKRYGLLVHAETISSARAGVHRAGSTHDGAIRWMRATCSQLSRAMLLAGAMGRARNLRTTAPMSMDRRSRRRRARSVSSRS